MVCTKTEIRTQNGQKRVIAFCCDMLIMTGFILLMSGISQFIGPIICWALTMIFCIAYLLIPIIKKKQTLGKIISHTKVVSFDDEEISWTKVFIRELIKYGLSIISFGLYVFIGGLMVISRKDELTIHDMILKTHVIDNDLKQKIEEKKNKEDDPYYRRF